MADTTRGSGDASDIGHRCDRAEGLGRLGISNNGAVGSVDTGEILVLA